MLKDFSISKENIHNYQFSEEITPEISFYYNNEKIYNTYTDGIRSVSCYGYCFDVREPKREVPSTLRDLVETNNINEDSLYLNGHFVMIFDDSESVFFFTDATSFTSIYYSVSKKIIVPSNTKIEGYTRYNPRFSLDLHTLHTQNIQKNFKTFKNKRIERLILNNVSKQNEYFHDKKLNVNFKANKYGKTLLSILNFSLRGQNLIFDNDENNVECKNANNISRAYQMNILKDIKDNATDQQYFANMQLMNYKKFMGPLSEHNIEFKAFKEEHEELYLSDKQLEIDFKIVTSNFYNRNKNNILMYDPFNVRAIQELIYYYNTKEKFDPYMRIINILQPSLEFYDFQSVKNLKQQFNSLNQKYMRLQSEFDKVQPNYPFLNESYMKGYKVSNNLDGQVNENEIQIYPSSEIITKGEVYAVHFYKETAGLILIESFFYNERNAHRIKVEVNGEIFDINEFLKGKFMNLAGEVHLRMWYERNYNASSWQKAGKLLIKIID